MLFNRVASITVGTVGGAGVEITDLRMSFNIQKGATKSPNQCSVRIWNAAEATRHILERIGSVVIVKAGYFDDIGAATVFTGNVTRSLTVRENADWVTELELQDGFLEFRDTKVSISFAPSVKNTQVLQDIANRFNLPVRPLPADMEIKQYPSGFAFVGKLRDVMDKVCDYSGLEWSIQNREVQIIKKGGAIRQQAYLLSPDTGLIGSPAQEAKTMTEQAASKQGVTLTQPGVRKSTKRDKKGELQEVLQVLGYKVKTLLQPMIEPGWYVQLKSKGVDGEFFRVEEVTHNGDTHGPDWHSELTLRFIK